MQSPTFIAYYRVSTDRQGRSGLGLDAQRWAVESYLQVHGGFAVGEYTEVESGKRAQRPQLKHALAACRRMRAKLVIAKLDRLARNMAFVANLMDSGVEFVATDMPHADRFTLHIFAALAEEEGRRISERTRAALAAAKAKGRVLGTSGKDLAKKNQENALAHARMVETAILDARATGAFSLKDISARLNANGTPTASGGRWHPTTVRRVCSRLTTLQHPNWKRGEPDTSKAVDKGYDAS